MSGIEHIREMEKAVIGSVVDDPEANGPLVFERLDVADFDSALSHLAWAVHERFVERLPLNPPLVLEHLRLQGRMRPEYGPLLSDCLAFAWATPEIKRYVDALAEHYAERRTYGVALRMQQMAGSSPVSAIVPWAMGELASIADAAAPREDVPLQTLADVLAEPDVGIDWLIPGILPASDRLLITAQEGLGKSTMLRQAALSLALGVQMFDPTGQIEPQRTMVVDAEVSRAQLVRSLRRMHSFVSRHSFLGAETNLVVESRQAGLDLADPADQAWLLRAIRSHRPRLLAIGPLYRITSGDLNEEAAARVWQRLLEPLLEDGVSIVMEHHPTNAVVGQRGIRDLRPLGSSVIRRWFSQGVGIRGRRCETHDDDFCQRCARQARVEFWRGSRDDTAWPTRLRSPGSDIYWLQDVEHD